MTAALSYTALPPSEGWSTDDLDSLPEDGIRRELLDGVLLVSPTPTNIHQKLVLLLAAALEEGCPDAFDVNHGVEVRLDTRRSFIPDVLVTTAEAAQRRSNKYTADEVVVAIEVVLPTSQAMDRVTKPALFAQAGIPHYWLVDPADSLTIRAFELEPGNDVYKPGELFTDEVTVERPWQISFPMSRIRPRFL
jgi:Uma2 family endonuclease